MKPLKIIVQLRYIPKYIRYLSEQSCFVSLQQISSEQTSCRSPCSSTRRNKRGVPVTHGRPRPTTATDESCEQVRLQNASALQRHSSVGV